MHLPFVCIVIFKLLAQFPVDHLAHPVVSGLILSLCLFTELAYYVVDRFVSVTTLSSPAIFLLVYSCFDKVIIASLCVAIRRNTFGLVWFGLVWFYGISTFVDYLTEEIHLVWFGLVLWYINLCRLFNRRDTFGLVWFDLVLWYINLCRLFNRRDTFGLVWFGLVLWYINLCRLFNRRDTFGLVWFGFMVYQPL